MPHLVEVGAPAWAERGSYSKWTVALNQAFGTAINRNKINSPFFSACFLSLEQPTKVILRFKNRKRCGDEGPF